ncbi:hypothetical protein [Pseudomonas sp. NUPR-001]|uniref:hypothetical protein n=1 Tax=Pseudomonas sp. NUPR-001 TaxID=3416058 RepID=UPI003F96B855
MNSFRVAWQAVFKHRHGTVKTHPRNPGQALAKALEEEEEKSLVWVTQKYERRH